jgi:hypothetical protein
MLDRAVADTLAGYGSQAAIERVSSPLPLLFEGEYLMSLDDVNSKSQADKRKGVEEANPTEAGTSGESEKEDTRSGRESVKEYLATGRDMFFFVTILTYLYGFFYEYYFLGASGIRVGQSRAGELVDGVTRPDSPRPPACCGA